MVATDRYAMPAKVFLSYRRQDTQSVAYELHRQLTKLFNGQGTPEHSVFLDELFIEAGRDFRKVLRFAIQSCQIVMVLIGENWLRLLEAANRSPTEDYVIFEIRTALRSRHSVQVIPVLFGNVEVPLKKDLPRGIRRLVSLQVLKCRDRKDLRSGRLAQHVYQLLVESYIPFERFQEYSRIPADVERDYILRIDNGLLRAVSATNPAVRRSALAKSLGLACHYVRLRDIRELVTALRDYPSEQNAVIESFLGDRVRFNHFLRLAKSAVRQLGANGEQFLNEVRNLQRNLKLVQFNPKWIDEFSDAWKSLETMICDRAARFEDVPSIAAAGTALRFSCMGLHLMERLVSQPRVVSGPSLNGGPQVIAGMVAQWIRQLQEAMRK